MIDKFCCDVVDGMPVSEVAELWNVTQAVLRKASSSIEQCMLALGIAVACVVPLVLVDIVLDPNGTSGPLAPSIVALGVVHMAMTAAMITDKCLRVPALVNAVSFGPGTDLQRQQVVDYVVSSSAGFYIFSTRLTTVTILKFAYGWSVVAVGIVTKVVAV